MMNKLFRRQEQTMNEMKNVETNYPFSIEVGHSKSGSEHVMIIKSLKVQGHDLPTVFKDLQAALKGFDILTPVEDR